MSATAVAASTRKDIPVVTDDLRTKIAKVLYHNFCGPFWDDETEEAIEMWCCDADRLIRELERDYIIVEPGTPLAQRIAQWQLSNWDGHWEGPPDE